MADEREAGKPPAEKIGMHPDVFAALSARAISREELAILAARARGQIAAADNAVRGNTTVEMRDVDTLADEDPPKSAVAGAKATNTQKGKVRPIRATKTRHRPGVLSLKEYPITEDTLNNIGTLRLSAAFWFSVGSLALGFALSSLQSLFFTGNVSDTARAVWITITIITGIIALIAYAAGGFYFFRGQSVIQFVKDNTSHDPVE